MYIRPLGNEGGSGFLCFAQAKVEFLYPPLFSIFSKSPVVADVESVPQIQEPLI